MSLHTKIERAYAYNACLCARQAIVRRDGASLTTDDIQALQKAYPAAEVLTEEDTDLCILALPDTDRLPEAYEAVEIRQFFATHNEEECFHLARAKGITNWRSAMRFCPKCGSPLIDSPTLTARECPDCRSLHFPKIEPCVIIAIRKGDEILLARHVERNQDIYACIAGFVEDGESLEHAVRREIREEVGIEVTDIRYFGSQSWPFPYQLMIGFTAEYASGDIRLQQEELSDARWFKLSDLPNHPRPGSISHALIHAADSRC